MPIEFRCTQCGKLLRTPDDSVGKQARCPACGNTMTVAPPGDAPSGGSPFGPPPSEPNPYVPPPETPNTQSPYAPPGAYTPYAPPGVSTAYAASRVAGPAIALIVTMGLMVPLFLLLIVVNVLVLSGGLPAGMGGDDFENIMVSGGPGLVICGIQLLITIAIIVGAVRMKKLESYGFAMTAAILSLVPCTSPCCWLGLPFGIWALVVLSDAQVKSAFRS